MGNFSDFGKALGKMATMIGAAAMIEAEKSLRTQLIDEVGSMVPRRRKVGIDRMRLVLADDHGLDRMLVREIEKTLGVALFEGQGKGVWPALDKAMRAAQWNPIQRVAFLQKLAPDATITLSNIEIGKVPATTSAPAEPAPEAPAEVVADVPPKPEE